MTPAEIAEWRTACEAATPGEWWVQMRAPHNQWPKALCTSNGKYQSTRCVIATHAIDELATVDAEGNYYFTTHKEETANFDLMALARTALPRCLDEIERLREAAECWYLAHRLTKDHGVYVVCHEDGYMPVRQTGIIPAELFEDRFTTPEAAVIAAAEKFDIRSTT